MVDSNDSDSLIPIQDVCREFLGNRVAPATIWRWLRRGAHGAILRGVYVRGRWHTTRRDFDEFLRRQTENRLAGACSDNTDPDSDDEQLRMQGLL